MTTRQHNPLASMETDVLIWLGICALILALGLPAVLDAIARATP